MSNAETCYVIKVDVTQNEVADLSKVLTYFESLAGDELVDSRLMRKRFANAREVLAQCEFGLREVL